MKNTLLAVMAAATIGLTTVTTAVVAAEPLTIVLPSGSTGTFNIRFQIMKPELERVWGGKIRMVYGKNCILAKKLIEEATSPVLNIWMIASNVVPKCDMPAKDQNLVAIEQNGLRLCTSKATGLSLNDILKPKRVYTVGTPAPFEEYEHWFEGMNAEAGTNFKAVPYSSSGKARRGLLAGDVDLIFISPGNSNKLMKAGGKCFFSTLANGEPKWKLPALNSLVKYSKAILPQGIYYAGFHMTDAQLEKVRSVFRDIASGKNENFNKFAGGKDVKLSAPDSETMKRILAEIFEKWKR